MLFITRLAVKKPWITYFLTALVAGAALWGTLTLKHELFPDIELPMMTIVTVYPQAGHDQVMTEVTMPIESAIADIPRLKHITSTSVENTSIIFVEFEYGTRMTKVVDTVKQNISKLALPDAVVKLPS